MLELFDKKELQENYKRLNMNLDDILEDVDISEEEGV